MNYSALQRALPTSGILLLAVLAAAGSPVKEYHEARFAFRYPADLTAFRDSHGHIVRLASARRRYWQDAIIIRKHDKKIEECDLPQSTTPDTGPKRRIAGRTAHGYSGEDAAMNRFTKLKGYIIETRNDCWRFELIRTGHPFQKFDLPPKELKRLNKLSDHDLKKANSAFETVLQTFRFRSLNRQ